MPKNKKHIFFFTLQTSALGICVLLLVYAIYLKDHTIPTSTIMQPSSSPSSPHALAPILSNQWYSSLLVDFPTQPLYALPLAFTLSPHGMSFSYPQVTKTADTIFAPFTPDFTIGYSHNLQKPHLTAVTDWTISGQTSTAQQETLSFTIGHGLPFALLTANKSLTITTTSVGQFFDASQKPLPDDTTTDNFGMTMNGNNYIFVFPHPIHVHKTGTTISLAMTQRVFVGLLDNKSHYALFQNNAAVDILDTQALPQLSDNTLLVNYVLTVANGTPLICLYPHQTQLIKTNQHVLGTYNTLRGPLSLVQTNQFTTVQQLVIPPETFMPLHADYPDLRQQIHTDITTILQGKVPTSKDYYLGTWFGEISNLLLLADMVHDDTDKTQLLQYVEPIFLASLQNFSYNKKETSIIATYPEFGNEKLNDHHFHYGYYIRTASVLSSFDLSFLAKVQTPITAFVSDIATSERYNTSYPFLRTFDVYEGHSWADGFGSFADGNNQESSSEAINAWYALYLWAHITNNDNLQKTALYLYNTEIQSAETYWFDVTNQYSAPYAHGMGIIVWGGKVDFHTWFSNDVNMKYGIELLPITPASGYLGKLPSFTKYQADFQRSGGNEQKSWGDLFTMWRSYYQPEKTILLKNRQSNFQDDNTRSLYLYTLYKNYEDKPTLQPTP